MQIKDKKTAQAENTKDRGGQKQAEKEKADT